MYVGIHAHMHACIHTYRYFKCLYSLPPSPCVRTYIHTHIHYPHTYTHTRTVFVLSESCLHTHTCARAYAYIHAYIQVRQVLSESPLSMPPHIVDDIMRACSDASRAKSAAGNSSQVHFMYTYVYIYMHNTHTCTYTYIHYKSFIHTCKSFLSTISVHIHT